jgi:flagellar protein FliO/FliZ
VISLYLGGEKLNISRNVFQKWRIFFSPVFLVVIVIFTGLFAFNALPLSAQDTAAGADAAADVDTSANAGADEAAGDPSGVVARDPRAAEQAILLGTPPTPGAAQAQGPASVFVIIRMILVLVLAAAAIYGVVWFIKKASRRTEPKDPNLHVLSSVHLGLNRYVHIVSVGSQAWLLGAADGGVALITEIEDKDIVNAMLLADSQKSGVPGPGGIIDFKSMLRRFGLTPDGKAPTPDSIKKRRERLKGL